MTDETYGPFRYRLGLDDFRALESEVVRRVPSARVKTALLFLAAAANIGLSVWFVVSARAAGAPLHGVMFLNALFGLVLVAAFAWSRLVL